MRFRSGFGWTGLTLCFLLTGCDQQPLTAPSMQAANSESGASVSAPSLASAAALSATQIDLAWQDNASNELGFEVHRSSSPGGVFSLRLSTGSNVINFRDEGLSAATQYCYKVRAFRKIGNKPNTYSVFSNVACATTPPPPPPPPPPVAAPSAMTVIPLTSEHIAVSWTDNSDNEDGFRLERSATSAGPWTPAATFGPNSTSFTLGLLPGEQQVCYRVFSFNALGSSLPSNVDCTTPPARPSGLTAVGIAGPAIDLAWTDNSGAEDGYQVSRAASGEPWIAVADLPANTTSYRDAGVIADNTYYYEVRAKKDGGFSYPSNTASAASASAPPVAPTDVTATPNSSSAVWIAWVDNSPNDGGFRIERSTDGGATWVSVAVGGAGGSAIDSALVSEQPVCYRVFAFNNQGDSPPSNSDCTVPPAGPTNLMVNYVEDLVVDLTWFDNSGVEDGYELWASGSCGFFPIASLPANTISYRYVIEDPYGTASFYVVATKDGGYSDFSSRPPSGDC
jgi:hypothetical protein